MILRNYFLGWMMLTATAHAGVVGDPAHPELLPAALNFAYQNGDRDIVIAPGTYDIPATGKDIIVLDHWKDATILAPKVLLIFGDGKPNPLKLEHCDHVAFEGATLRLKIAPDTQGRVRKIGSDPQGIWCEWQIDGGYRADIDPKKLTFDVVDPATRLLKVQTGDMGPMASETLAPDLFRLHFRGKEPPSFAVNDWLVTRAGIGTVLCHVSDSTNVTLRGLTLQNGGFGTIFETGGGGNHYLNCRIEPGPKPVGATEDQIISCGADGFHSAGTNTGPDIEDCVFSGVFLDDCIAIHGTFQKIVSSAGMVVTLTAEPRHYAAGDPIRFSNEKGFFAEANCAAVKDLGHHQIEITMDLSLNVPVDAKADNPMHCGRGYKILRCHLGNTRSRGILVKGDDGLIDHCTIEGCGMSAISIGPEYYWNEADYCRNVTVSNNTIRNCVKGNRGDGTLWVHGDGAIGNRNVIIKDNVFDTDYGQYMIKVEWSDGVAISRNRIVHPYSLPLQHPGEVVHLAHTRHVSLNANVLEDAGPSFGKLLGAGDDVSDPGVLELGGIGRR